MSAGSVAPLLFSTVSALEPTGPAADPTKIPRIQAFVSSVASQVSPLMGTSTQVKGPIQS